MKKRQSMILVIISSIFHLLPSISYSYDFAGGTGEPNDPFQIATAEQLISINSDPNLLDKHFVLINDIDLDPNLPGGQVFDRAVIAPDLDDTTNGFQGWNFTGRLDGQNHTIINLTVNAANAYVGLFGRIGSNGSVCYVRLIGGSVQGATDAPMRYGTGGLAGVNQGSILGCHCDITVKGIEHVGGLVGYNLFATISNSYSTGSVSGTNRVGGLVGDNVLATVSNSYSTGSVSSTDKYVGGLVGFNSTGTISNCYSIGFTSSTNGSTSGLVGGNSGTVSNSFWDMETSGVQVSDGEMGLTTDEMQNPNTFLDAGWDFLNERTNGVSEIWLIPPKGGYPKLSIFNGYVPPLLPGVGTPDDPYILAIPEDLGTVCYRPESCYQLAADIDLSGIIWSTAVIPVFTEKFEGQGHLIQNLSISGRGHLGLFGSLNSKAVVSGLGLEDANVEGSGDYVGSLIGFNDGTVSNCYSTGSVSNNSSSTYDSVGGLVGTNHGILSNCYNSGLVIGEYSVGGLAGDNYGTLINNFNTGLVSGLQDVGGLVGRNYGTVSNSYNTGSISGTEGDIGGLVGNNRNGMVLNSYSMGLISGGDVVGGLVGLNASGTISNCYSTGDVSGSSTLGGLIGMNRGEITQSYSTSNVRGDAIMHPPISAHNIGGLVGRNEGTINLSYCTGAVVGDEFIGGLVGKNYGVITSSYSSGAASGFSFVGGLVGFHGESVITSSYSIGHVSTGFEFIGGLVGLNSGTITASLWDIETSGQSDSDGGQGLVTVQMQDINTFLNVGWDFVDETENGIEDIWFMPEQDYPHLSWESE